MKRFWDKIGYYLYERLDEDDVPRWVTVLHGLHYDIEEKLYSKIGRHFRNRLAYDGRQQRLVEKPWWSKQYRPYLGEIPENIFPVLNQPGLLWQRDEGVFNIRDFREGDAYDNIIIPESRS